MFLLFPNYGNAQKYTLQQCLDFAVNNSYAAHRAKMDIQEANYRRQEAQAGVLPQVSASGSLDDNVVLGKVILPGEIIGQPGTNIAAEMGTKYALDASARLEQVVFAPSLFTGIKIAKNSIELQRLRATMTGEEIIFDVSHAWYDALNSMQELENVNDMLAKQDSLYLLIKRRVEENITREVDLNRIKVNLTNLHLRGENIRKTISQQKRYLQILIGMSVGDEFELDDATGWTENFSPLPPAPQHNIELDILNKQKDILGLELRQIKNEYLPTLSAVVSGSYQFQAENLRLRQEDWFNSFFVGARLSIPVFDGFAKRSRIRQKQSQLHRLDMDIRETGQTVSMNLQNASEQLEVARKSIEAQNENLQLAEKVYDQTVMLYREGLAGVTDLLETETSLREAGIARAAEIVRYKKAEIDLLKANGTLYQLRIKNEE